MRVYFVESVFYCGSCLTEWKQPRTINSLTNSEFLPETNCPVCDSTFLIVKAA